MYRYEAPEFELVIFETEEIVTAGESVGFGDNDFDINDTDWN